MTSRYKALNDASRLAHEELMPPPEPPSEPVFFATLRQFYTYHDARPYDVPAGQALYRSLKSARSELAEEMLTDDYDPRDATSTRDPLYLAALYYIERNWYPGLAAEAETEAETELMTPEEHALWTAVYTTVLAPQLEDTRRGSVDTICFERANSAVRKLRAAAELLKDAR